jgi:hypothetical protein
VFSGSIMLHIITNVVLNLKFYHPMLFYVSVSCIRVFCTLLRIKVIVIIIISLTR